MKRLLSLFCLLAIGLGWYFLMPKPSPGPPAPKMESDYHTHADGSKHSHGHGSHSHAKARSPQTLTQMQEHLKKNPEDVAVRSRLIHQAIDERKPEIAIQQCYSILENDPENEYATSHLATALLEQGDLEKAMHYAARNVARNPDAANTLVIAHVFFRKGELKRAADMFQKALDLEPGNQDAREGLRRCQQ